MRRTLAPFACLLLVLPQLAEAGPWPRERGEGFISAGATLNWPQTVLSTDTGTIPPPKAYTTFYLEYGVTDRVTLGLDLGRAVSGKDKTVAFLQFPLRNRDTGPKVALQLGLGQVGGDFVLRPGLALGWGLQKGWVSAEGMVEIGLDGSGTDMKLDMTWGRNLPRDRKLILQMQLGAPSDDPVFARFAPSVVIPLRGNFKAEIGATWGLTGDEDVSIKLGLWTKF